MASCLPAVAEQLLKDLQRTYSEKSEVPDDLLLALGFVFGSCTLQALDLVDQRSVTCMSSPSGRVAFQIPSEWFDVKWLIVEKPTDSDFLPVVETVATGFCVNKKFQALPVNTHTQTESKVLGGSGRLYTCYTSCHYCPCPAFSFSVLRRNESLVCKHILAAYLCQAMGLCQQEQVSDQHMTLILSGKAQPDS